MSVAECDYDDYYRELMELTTSYSTSNSKDAHCASRREDNPRSLIEEIMSPPDEEQEATRAAISRAFDEDESIVFEMSTGSPCSVEQDSMPPPPPLFPTGTSMPSYRFKYLHRIDDKRRHRTTTFTLDPMAMPTPPPPLRHALPSTKRGRKSKYTTTTTPPIFDASEMRRIQREEVDDDDDDGDEPMNS